MSYRRRSSGTVAGRARLNRADQQAPIKPHPAPLLEPHQAAHRGQATPVKAGSEKRANPVEPDPHGIDAKKTDALLSIALARLSSAFSRFNRVSSADSSVVIPGRWPASTSA